MTGKIMVIAIVFFFIVLILLLFLHLYAKWFWGRMQQPRPPSPSPSPSSSPRPTHRLVFSPHQDPVRRGLDISILKSLPVVIFQSQELEDGLQCAVCLSQLFQGEKARLLPKCNHGFHLDCIDMWFQSHSTCPLCRTSVAPQDSISSTTSAPSVLESHYTSDQESRDSPNLPTNLLFCGDQTQVSLAAASSCLEDHGTSSAQLDETQLVINAPVQMATDSFADEESKSPNISCLRSLQRLSSRENIVSCGNSSIDV